MIFVIISSFFICENGITYPNTFKSSNVINGPTWGTNSPGKISPNIGKGSIGLSRQDSSAGYFFLGMISFFREFISPLDGATCPKVPVCSLYGKQALRKFGAIPGVLMSFERILRCHPMQNKDERVDPVP